MDAEIREYLLEFAERTVDFVGVSDGDGRVLYLNDAACKRLGVSDPQGLTTADLFPPEAFARYYDEVRPELLRRGEWNGTMPVMTASGESVPMLMSAVAGVGAGGEITSLVTHARDLAAAYVASTTGDLTVDQVTGLINRSVLQERIADARDAAAMQGRRVAVLRAAVIGMRDVNATFGSDIGDNVLRVLAYRLTQAVRATDAVARIDDDEFAVLFYPVRDAGEALRLAEAVRDSMEIMPIVTAAGEIGVSVALGVAIDELTGGIDQLLERAAALRTERTVEQRSQASSPDLSELRLAVSQGEVRSYVQPVVDLRTGTILGYQGLARWPRRDRDVVDVEALLGSDASTPLAPVVDLRIVRDTAAVVTLMSRTSELLVYAPVSQPLLDDVRIEQYLWEIIDAFVLPAHRLSLQLEQRDVERASPATVTVLQRLLEVGARLVVTNATGDTDVTQLAELGFSELHFAPAQSRRAHSDPVALTELRQATRRAHELGLLVGVVGVDDEQQQATWRDIACDVATGSLFGAPVIAETVE